MNCNLCDDPAIAVFYMDRGCLCNDRKLQALCLHHAHKSKSASGGCMELVVDLTINGQFTNHWNNYVKGNNHDRNFGQTK